MVSVLCKRESPVLEHPEQGFRNWGCRGIIPLPEGQGGRASLYLYPYFSSFAPLPFTFSTKSMR